MTSMYQRTADGTLQRQTRGLGDTVHQAVQTITAGRRSPCVGCKAIENVLNKVIPFRQRI